MCYLWLLYIIYSWGETTVLVVFIVTVLLWFFREPGYMPGWSVLFKEDYVSDGTVAMTMASLLFILPVVKPNFFKRKNVAKGE